SASWGCGPSPPQAGGAVSGTGTVSLPSTQLRRASPRARSATPCTSSSSASTSPLAMRLAALAGVASERPFAFEHDGVLFHGVLDVFHLADGRALVADFKSNLLGELTPGDVVEAEYRLQRLVYAIACFRAGADEVEVVYQFLERPDELVAAPFRRDQLPELEAELSAAVAQIQAGRFPPR